MTTVDDAIEAGALAIARSRHELDDNNGIPGSIFEELLYEAREAAKIQWPILSAPLRELHPPLDLGDFIGCHNCPDECAVAEFILQTDKELGCE